MRLTLKQFHFTKRSHLKTDLKYQKPQQSPPTEDQDNQMWAFALFWRYRANSK